MKAQKHYMQVKLHALCAIIMLIALLTAASCNPSPGIFRFGELTYTPQQIIAGDAPPLLDGGPIRNMRSISQIGLTKSLLKHGALLEVWGKPSSSEEIRENAGGFYSYYLDEHKPFSHVADKILTSHFFVTYDEGRIIRLTGKVYNNLDKAANYSFGKLRLIGSSLSDYARILGEPTSVPFSNPADRTTIARWYLLFGKAPRRVLMSIQVTFIDDASRWFHIYFAYEE